MKKTFFLLMLAAVICLGCASCVNTGGGGAAAAAGEYQGTPYFIASRFLENLQWALETRNTTMFERMVSAEFVPDAEELLFEVREQTYNEASLNLWYRIDRILPGRNNEYDVQVRWKKSVWDTTTKTFVRQDGVGSLVLQIQDGKCKLVRKYGNLFF